MSSDETLGWHHCITWPPLPAEWVLAEGTGKRFGHLNEQTVCLVSDLLNILLRDTVLRFMS